MFEFTDIAIFQVLVLLPTGLPFVGARVRVFNSAGTNVTAQLTGESVITTLETGQFAAFLSIAEPLPAGVYTIKTSNQGYADVSSQTEASFAGRGTFALTVGPRNSVPTTVPVPAVRCVSPMFPVKIAMPAPDVAPGDWQLIETIVHDETGETSAIETPVVLGISDVNIQTRLRLEPNFHFVPDGSGAIIDPNFSGTFVVSANSISPSGTLGLQGTALYLAANMVPDGNANDLTDFTDGWTDYAKWIVFGDVVKFIGRYLDVMIWLPSDQIGGCRMYIEHYTATNQLSFSETTDLPNSEKVVRVAIPDVPANISYSLAKCLNNDGDDISEILTITYHA